MTIDTYRGKNPRNEPFQPATTELEAIIQVNGTLRKLTFQMQALVEAVERIADK